MSDYKKFDWKSVGLNFGDWDETKLWALKLPISEIKIEDLLWHFDVPFWTNDRGERWSVTPWEVLGKQEATVNEQKRINAADTSHPIDIMQNQGRWLVLDGLHRLVKLYQNKELKVKARVLPIERFSEIAVH